MKARNPSTGNLETVYVKALDSLPVGTSVEFAGTTIPDELKGTWLFERGQELSRTEYAKLFSVIGTSYGAGDGSTTFNLPNKCGKVPVGLDTDDTDTDFNTIGKTGGSKYLQEHSHDITIITYTQPGSLGYGDKIYNTSANDVMEKTYTRTTENAGTGDSGNLQPYIVKNYIIKVKETTPLTRSTVNTHSESTENAYSADYSNKVFGGVVLYNNATGTTGTVTLSDSADDYDYIEIYFVNDSNVYENIKVFSPNNKTVSLNITHGSGTTLILYSKEVTISGTTITNVTGQTSVFTSSVSTSQTTTNISIVRVVGYKLGL